MGSTGTLDSPWHLADGVRATVPHRLASGQVVQLWRSGPEPHLHGWYEPAALLCHRLRSDASRAAAPLGVDDVVFLGRVHLPSGGALFLYRHRRTGGEVLVDANGTPHHAVDDRRRRAGHRFDPVPAATALAALLTPTPPWSAHPAGKRWPDGTGPLGGGSGGEPSDPGAAGRGDGPGRAAAGGPAAPPEQGLAKVLAFRHRSADAR